VRKASELRFWYLLSRFIGVIDFSQIVLPFGRLWFGEPNAVSNAIGYAMHSSRSHDAVIRVYDKVGNVIEMQKHAGAFKEP